MWQPKLIYICVTYQTVVIYLVEILILLLVKRKDWNETGIVWRMKNYGLKEDQYKIINFERDKNDKTSPGFFRL